MAVVLPSDISNLVGWFKAGTGVYKDAAKTQPCANGETVYTWANQVVGGNDLIQATAGSRPTYYDAGTYYTPYVSSAGDKSMTFTVGSYSQPYSYVFMMRYVGLQDTYSCLVIDGSGGAQITFNSGTGTYKPYLWAGTSPAVSTVDMATWRPSLLCAVLNGTSSTLRIDRASAYSGSTNIGTDALQDLSLFGDNGLNYTVKAEIFEFMVYSKGLSLTEQQDLENYLSYTHRVFPNTESLTESGDLNTPGLGSVVKGIVMSSMDTMHAGATHAALRYGVRKDDSEGNPSAPCLAIDYAVPYRFRWPVRSGDRTIQVDAKQVSNIAGKRPKLVVKANPAIGVDLDVEGSAGAGTGWVTIGPLDVTPDADGILWVELQNVDTDTLYSPAFFDNIQVT